MTQESRRRVRVFWTSDLEYHLSVEIFHHSLKTVDWSYIEYHITGITDASRRRIGRCCRLASSLIPRIRSWSSTLRPKWVLTARDFGLFIDLFIPTIDSEHGICYTQPEKLPGKTPIGHLLAQTYSFVYSSIFLFRRRPGEAITIWQLIKSETSDCNMPKMLWKCQLRTLKPVFDNTAGITLSGLSKHFFQRNSRAFKRGTWTRC